MKKLTLIILMTVVTYTVSAAQTTKKNQKAVIKTTLNCDHCKQCETCGQNFQANMLKIKGVKMYELNETKMTITVYFNSLKTDLKTIKTAISKMGFDADEIKADVTGYEKLDSCCKKI